MRNSIRHQLLVGLTAAIVTLWLVVIGATYLGASREVDALFDTQLEQSARVATRTLFGMTMNEEDSGEKDADDQYKKNLAIQVWDENGDLVVNSQNAPATPLTQSRGFFNSIVSGERWRTFSFFDRANGLTVHAGEPYRPRDYLTRHVVIQSMYPVLIGLPVVTLLIWIIVTHGFRPMKKLVAEVHRRDPDNLNGIVAPYAPAEVQPLVEELNVLLGRLENTLDNERHFVGDAAHELRTPLSGLKAQAEVALGARNESERTHALNNILIGVDRAGHLVNQLLTLSKLDETGQMSDDVIDLTQTIRDVIVDTLPIADQHGVDLSFEGQPAHLEVPGNREAIGILIRNLIDNAIKYSPVESVVTISLEENHASLFLWVSDQGPGIPARDRNKVFDRFHRRAGSGAYGSGLGLSIVKRVVDLHGGKIVLKDNANGAGLLVEVLFPRFTHKHSSGKTLPVSKPQSSKTSDHYVSRRPTCHLRPDPLMFLVNLYLRWCRYPIHFDLDRL